MNLRRFFSIVRKELIHIRRDRASLGMIIGMPVMMILLFGYAVTTEVNHIEMAVFDQSQTRESREYIQKFRSSNYFNPDYFAKSKGELNDLLDSGTVKAGLIIPPDFALLLKRGKSPQVQLVVDGSDPTVARTAFQSGVLVSQVYSISLQQQTLNQRGIRLNGSMGIDLRTKVWYNPNMVSTFFMIPGLIGLIMQNLTVMLTAFALVRERERGTIEQLIVTPVTAKELILGKLLPYVLIGFFDFLLALFLGTYWFAVPIKGSFLLLLSLAACFLICALAIGMLISTVAKTQLQAMQMAFLTLLPSILLSGYIFPREGMPAPIKVLGYLIPLTYFLKILRSIIVKGVGLPYLWRDTLALGFLCTVLLGVAVLRFRKKLD